MRHLLILSYEEGIGVCTTFQAGEPELHRFIAAERTVRERNGPGKRNFMEVQRRMARIAGVDLPREKRVEIGLTYIYGIGRSSSNRILEIGRASCRERV